MKKTEKILHIPDRGACLNSYRRHKNPYEGVLRFVYLYALGSLIGNATKLCLEYDESSGNVRCVDDGQINMPSKGVPVIIEHLRNGLRALHRWSPPLLRLYGVIEIADRFKMTSHDLAFSASSAHFILDGDFESAVEHDEIDCVSFALELSAEYRISLESFFDAVKTICAGFSLPVTVNGIEIKRHFALSDDFLEGLYGRYQIMNTRNKGGGDGRIYCYGLPAVFMVDGKRIQIPDGVVAHIDGYQNKFRINHSGCVISFNGALAQFAQEEASDIWTRHLEKEKTLLEPEDFAWRYSHSIQKARQHRLLNEMPLHPSMWGVYKQPPLPCRKSNEAAFIHGDELLQHTNRIIIDMDWENVGYSPSLSAYVYSLGWPVVTGKLDHDHWALRQALHPGSLSIQVSPYGVSDIRIIATGPLKGIRVVFCTGYTMTANVGAPKSEVEEAATFCGETGTLFVTPRCANTLQGAMWRALMHIRGTSKVQASSVLEDTKGLIKNMRKIFSLAVTKKPELARVPVSR